MAKCYRCNRPYKAREPWHSFCAACWSLRCDKCGKPFMQDRSKGRACQRCAKAPKGPGREFAKRRPKRAPSEKAAAIAAERRAVSRSGGVG